MSRRNGMFKSWSLEGDKYILCNTWQAIESHSKSSDESIRMNSFYIILISQFIFFNIARVDCGFESTSEELHSPSSGAHCSSTAPVSHILSDIKINLEISPDHHKNLHLKQVHRVLANEHLPVWIMKNEANTESSGGEDKWELELVSTVMKQLGGFSFYHDTETTSAAVYFHRRREFDGMIDTKYLIERLSIDKIHKSAKTKIRLGNSGILSREESMHHPPGMRILGADSAAKSDDKIRRTFENHLYPAYPEILIFIPCDFAQSLLEEDENHPDRYTPLISYILTLFNGADMLYSKLKETNIKLNIAGIVIETECGSSPFLKNCYTHPIDDYSDYSDMQLDAICAIEILNQLLFNYRRIIPFDSYDVTVILPRAELYRTAGDFKYGVAGVSQKAGTYYRDLLLRFPDFISIVQDKVQFRNYAVIAHELAHLMYVPHDVQLFVNDEECCQSIMKIEGSFWCERCLSWSQESEESFKKFFSSTDCCRFTNSPRSLHPPSPREILTADEQCRCYGFESTSSAPISKDLYCKVSLLCKYQNGEVIPSLLPLDGTPCSSDKVCWRNECSDIQFIVNT